MGQRPHSYEDLEVWQHGHRWVLDVYRYTRRLPREELFGVASQLRRAAVSVTANVVEGFRRLGINDKLRFYNTAQASLDEACYLLRLCEDLDYGQTKDLRAAGDTVGRLLAALVNSTRRRL